MFTCMPFKIRTFLCTSSFEYGNVFRVCLLYHIDNKLCRNETEVKMMTIVMVITYDVHFC